jgi:hypothetical protein
MNGGKRVKERKSSIHDLILARLLQSVWRIDNGEAIEESGFIYKEDQEIGFPFRVLREPLAIILTSLSLTSTLCQ